VTSKAMDTDEAARAWISSHFAPDEGQWAALETYVAMLRAANDDQNLVAASTLSIMWVRHIADSAQLLNFDRRDDESLWLDLGSGPGLPGLIIAILTKQRRVMLVESRTRRCQFLAEAIDRLGLGARVALLAMPLERVPATQAATISARAFAPLPRLINLSARFSTASTRWILPKGRNAVNELALLPTSWQKLFHVEQSVTDAGSGILVGTGTVERRRKQP
jgi:16S rRNA (guanine527-N7)-methyltransferase